MQGSLLCVGLDPLPDLFPPEIAGRQHAIFEFNCAIVRATAPYACAFKPQIAHYAALAAENELARSIAWIQQNYPQHLVILDAKRGDIGSTARLYVVESFDRYQADAVTLNPYLGTDALSPFLERADRGCFVLCRTSNPDSCDFQLAGEPPLYAQVAQAAADRWNQHGNAGLVVGTNWPEAMRTVRVVAPNLPVLAPGIGAQAGDLEGTLRHGLNAEGTGLIINASRSICYASAAPDFAEAAAAQAKALHEQIGTIRSDVMAQH